MPGRQVDIWGRRPRGGRSYPAALGLAAFLVAVAVGLLWVLPWCCCSARSVLTPRSGAGGSPVANNGINKGRGPVTLVRFVPRPPTVSSRHTGRHCPRKRVIRSGHCPESTGKQTPKPSGQSPVLPPPTPQRAADGSVPSCCSTRFSLLPLPYGALHGARGKWEAITPPTTFPRSYKHGVGRLRGCVELRECMRSPLCPCVGWVSP